MNKFRKCNLVSDSLCRRETRILVIELCDSCECKEGIQEARYKCTRGLMIHLVNDRLYEYKHCIIQVHMSLYYTIENNALVTDELFF